MIEMFNDRKDVGVVLLLVLLHLHLLVLLLILVLLLMEEILHHLGCLEI